MAVWKVPVSGGEPRQVTKNGGYIPFPSKDGKTIYFLKNPSQPTSLWKVPAAGGAEAQILDAVTTNSGFAVASGGIYFVWQERLQFLDFSTGLSNTIRKIEKPTAMGMAVSPDEHWLVLTETNEATSDLMLVENFR